jgi:hypothetical protein
VRAAATYTAIAAFGAASLGVGLSGCSPSSSSKVPAPPVAPLLAAPAQRDDCAGGFGSVASLQLEKPKLRARGASARLIASLDASAHRYFRLLAVEYSSRVCFAFRDLRWHLPVVAVHGDAHVEQFVVTPKTFGLEDYDQAGFGPAVVDLVRFASSLHLVCRESRWACDPEQAVTAYFRAYRDALDRPPARALPAVVERVRKRVPQATASWLAWADALTQPMAPAVEQATKKRWAEFLALQGDVQPQRSRRFYDIVRLGNLQMGIGSAMEAKRLFRVRGETDSPDDDVILEARSTSQPLANTCVWRPAHGGSLHTLMFMSLLGPRMPEVFGTVVLNDSPGEPAFWMQAWEPGYYELALRDIESQSDLDELGIDAARQLAGHFWTRFPEPLRVHQRFAQLRAFDLAERRARDMARDLAAETHAAWEKFRAAK